MAWFQYLLSHTTPEADRELADLPGVSRRERSVSAHDNSGWLVESILNKHGIRFTARLMRADFDPLVSIESLQQYGLREWVPGFMAPYQRDAVMALGHKSGHLWHAAGCLAGDTEIVVTRGGCARRMVLRDLVFKFNGGASRHPRNGRVTVWDPTIPTYTQSLDPATGYIRRNRITAAIDSGRKAVYLLRAEVGPEAKVEIRATADHRFWTPDGWRRLEDLRVGDSVMAEVWPEKSGRAGAKNTYRQVENLWQHPNVQISMPGASRGSKRVARVPYHRLVAEAHILNDMRVQEFVGRVLLGELEGLRFLDPELHVHHVDGNVRNNCPSNLVILSREEHLRQHGQEDGWKNVSARAQPAKITGIEFVGEEPTFDLTMAEPFDNFVANGIVVHNSGKTLTSIVWSLVYPGNTLVTTRASVRRNFGREIERFTQHRAFVIEEGKDAEQLEDTDALYVVVGWEMLPDCLESILKWKPVNWIADEIHKCKSHRRWGATVKEDGGLKFDPLDNIAHAAMKVSRAVKRRIGATATPIKDRTRDLWAQLDLVHPDAWGPFYKEPPKASFTTRYCAARKGAFGGIETTGASNLDELWDRVSLVAHHVPHSETHRHLPPRRRLVTYIPSRDQNAATGFQQMMKKAARSGRGALLEARLMEAAAKKRKFLMELLEEAVIAGQKVVVFTGRREDCDKLGEEVTNRFGKTGAAIFVGHGGTPAGIRDDMQQAYMASTGATILVGTGDAWGEGVNLQDTDLMLIAMLPYTPGQVVQWEGRVARHGQKRPVLIQYLVAESTVDEHVASILLTKLPAVERVSHDDSVEGLADQLRGSDQEEEIIDSILSKLGVA